MRAILEIGVLVVTVLAMVIVGMELAIPQLRSVSRSKSRILTILTLQMLLVPALALLVARLLALSAHLTAGLLLLAACPVGNMTNFYSLLARANHALSVVVNALSCLLSFATMAIVFKVYSLILGAQFEFPVPGFQSVLRLTLLVVFPVLGGIWLRQVKPDLVKRHVQKLIRLCFAGLGVLLVSILLSERARVAADWWPALRSASLFIVLTLLGGYGVAWILRFASADRVTMAFLFAVRNIGVALVVAVALVNRPEYAVFATVYFLTQVPLVLVAVAVSRWTMTGEAEPAPILCQAATKKAVANGKYQTAIGG